MHYRLLLITVSILLTACSLKPVTMPKVQKHVLQYQARVKPAKTAQTLTVLVEDVVADAGLATTDMYYMNKPTVVTAYSVNRWLAPPAQLLTPMLVRALQESKQFKAVARPPFSGKVDRILRVSLASFYRNLLTTPSHMAVRLRVTWLDGKTLKVLSNKIFAVRQPVEGSSVAQGVQAANSAIAAFLQKVVVL